MGETAAIITAAGGAVGVLLAGIFAGFVKILHEVKKMQNGAADKRTASAVKEVCDVVRDEFKEHRRENADFMKPVAEKLENVTRLQTEMLAAVRGKARSES